VPRAGRLALVLLALLAGCPPGGPTAAARAQDPPRPRSLPAVVVKVVSGDSINVFVNGEVTPVRYIGIAAPTPGEGADGGEPQGREALAFNRALVFQKNVRLEFDVQERDAEGRLLAYVWVGEVLANILRTDMHAHRPLPNDSDHETNFINPNIATACKVNEPASRSVRLS